MAKKKEGTKRKRPSILYKLVSSAGTGYYYLARRNPKKRPTKMEFLKYDPTIRKHVLFVEQKLES